MAMTQERHTSAQKATGEVRLRAIEIVVSAIAAVIGLFGAMLVHETVANFWLTIVMASVAWVLVAHAGVFKVSISMEDWQVLPTVAVATLVGFVGTAVSELLFKQTVHSIVQYLLSGLVTFATLCTGVLVARQAIRLLWRSGNFRTTAVVVGNEFTTHELVLEMRDHQQLGIDIVGSSGTANDGSLARLVADTRPDRVIIAGDSTHRDIELASTLSDTPARVYIMPQLLAAKTGSAWFAQHQVNGFPLIRVDNKSAPLSERFVAPSGDFAREI